MPRTGDCQTTSTMQRADFNVVPCVYQILKAHWGAAASMAMTEIELGCAGEFKVAYQRTVLLLMKASKYVLLVPHGSPMQQQSRIHHVKPDVQWCSCGAWQDCTPSMFPCQHVCVLHRKWKRVNLNYVLVTNLGDKYYMLGKVKNAFMRNISIPVSLDGTFCCNTAAVGSAMDQKDKKMTSKFLAAEDLTGACSNCACRGHN